jgi:cholinesterase
MKRGAILLACALQSGVLFSMAGLARSLPYDELIVIGDGLSDTGNAGRFSNGPVWVEYLAQDAGAAVEPARLGGTNLAVGGARTHGHGSSLREQTDFFLSKWSGPAANVRSLFIVYGGANDLRAAVHADDRQNLVPDAVRELGGIITDLVRAGATELLVPNLPDIGRTPEARRYGPAWVAEARKLAISFNEQLERALVDIGAKWPVRIHRFDVASRISARTRSVMPVKPLSFALCPARSRIGMVPSRNGRLRSRGTN